ncbi:MAG: DcrB-related protein [Gaiellales bacterium]
MSPSSSVTTADFELPLPEGWSDRTAVTLAGPVSVGGYVPNVVVTREALCSNLGLAGFADGQLRLLREHAEEVSVLSTEDVRLGSTRALLRTVRFRVGDTPALVQLQAFMVANGTGYALVGTTGEQAFPDAEPELRSIVEGFRLSSEVVPA